jgi:hypothetical protein
MRVMITNVMPAIAEATSGVRSTDDDCTHEQDPKKPYPVDPDHIERLSRRRDTPSFATNST